MDWTRPIDGYCERLGPGLWAEPVNAITNLAFGIVALWLWRRTDGLGRVLCVCLGAIGLGSTLFHTVAQPWAALLDVVPILGFVLIYVFAATRDFWGVSPGRALGITLLFFPYAALTGWGFARIEALGGSAVYAPVPLLIALYALALRQRAPEVARGLAIGAGLLVLSLTARTLDAPLCPLLPLGTHFLWHLLNAVMLGWMIHVWTQARLATRAHPM
ncbi:ceramidase domain-containing protein [Cognatishimia sp. F0-27]|uniref:ceramidase domain-containing protein n=1 Tax=Cognatishimia sp. F0-27 TaxID=2816855 RepID=UPI001D0BFE4C|nr:ceramidase domain-containing protein [Cognatishimia sp. F0-27]MCC1491569.1 ceramidase domain-containing protein [Cognatishimia sp. F0-27]